MLEGIKIISLHKNSDERGSFTEIFRQDWIENIPDKIVQTNLSISFPGMIRAWHRHSKGQVDYMVVVQGVLKICAFDETSGGLEEIISTGEQPQIVRIPGQYWHGFKAVGDKKSMLVYFVNRLYNHIQPDEERRPWDYKKIVPQSINGRIDDPRCNKAWDWHFPPHK